jgi:CheY-like chemotaxis protein
MATVLVVDDEFGIAELFEAILTDEGHRVLTAINGKHGLEMLAQEPVDLIFLDYMMPVMNGAAMLAVLLAHPIFRRIPVVIMSAMLEARIAERCSGYAAFLPKPFRIDQVVALANCLLGQVAELRG